MECFSSVIELSPTRQLLFGKQAGVSRWTALIECLWCTGEQKTGEEPSSYVSLTWLHIGVAGAHGFVELGLGEIQSRIA